MQLSVAEMVLLARGPWQEKAPKAAVFPWLPDLLILHRGEGSVREGRLGSCCQLGKPALSSNRQSGIIPSPALSPIMEEQLAKLDPLAVVLQGKAFSGDTCQEHAHRSSPELRCSLPLCEGTPCPCLSGCNTSRTRELVALSFASFGFGVFFVVGLTSWSSLTWCWHELGVVCYSMGMGTRLGEGLHED